MYNRYIPQNDGTYCRKSVSEPRKEPPRPEPPKPAVPPAPCCPPAPPPPQPRPRYQNRRPEQSIGSFWKQLLPRDFCTEDLLVILLLLLMAGDCPEEQNSALLTLALYLFL